MLKQHLTCWKPHPQILHEAGIERMFFLRVDVQIVKQRYWVLASRLADACGDLFGHHLPVTPLHAEYVVAHVNDYRVAV